MTLAHPPKAGQPAPPPPRACTRCGGHLLWARDEETLACFTCGWRWYPEAPLPLSHGAGLHPAAFHLSEPSESKRCPDCGQTLPATEFYARQGSRDELERQCRRCMCTGDRERRRQRKAAASG